MWRPKTAATPAGKTHKTSWLPYAEFGMGLYLVICAIWSAIQYGMGLMGAPFLMLSAFGFFYVSLLSFQEEWAKKRAAAPVRGAVKAASTIEL